MVGVGTVVYVFFSLKCRRTWERSSGLRTRRVSHSLSPSLSLGAEKRSGLQVERSLPDNTWQELDYYYTNCCISAAVARSYLYYGQAR